MVRERPPRLRRFGAAAPSSRGGESARTATFCAASSSSSSERGGRRHHLTNAKLVDGFHQLALLIDDFDCFFPLHVPSQLILQTGNHLPGRSVDDVTAGRIHPLPIGAPGQPKGFVAQLDASNLLACLQKTARTSSCHPETAPSGRSTLR